MTAFILECGFLLLVLVQSRSLIPGMGEDKPSFQEAMQFMRSIVDDVSIDLNDGNFEHLTQAATGATTGDWFVYFFNPSCTKCTFITPEWKFFAERMKKEEQNVNVAKVNVMTSEQIVRRFRIESTPTFLYFKGGYYYNFTAYVTADSLDAVVKQETYIQYEKKEVPPEMTVLRDWYLFIRWWVIRLRGYLLGGVGALALFLLLRYLRRRPKPAPVQPTQSRPKQD